MTTEYPLIATNVYEARWTEPQHSDNSETVTRLFKNQSTELSLGGVFGDQVFNDLTDDGQLPDGRPGTLIGAYLRNLEPGLGTAVAAYTDFESILQHSEIEILVAGTRVVKIPSVMLVPPGRPTIRGTTTTTTVDAFSLDLEGKGIPFEPHPILKNEGVEAILTVKGAVTAAAHDIAMGLIVTDVRAHKKMV